MYDELVVGAPYYDNDVDTGKVYILDALNLPDLWINGSLDDVYQEIPSGAQVNITYISAGDIATWWVVVQNDGDLDDTFDFNITSNMLAGWTREMRENVTWNQINDGDNVSLSPGEWRNYTLNISSNVSAVNGDESWVIVNVTSQNDTSKKDAVNATTRAIDITLPEISNVEAVPNIQETGGYVNITCNVTDNIGVLEVWVNISLPGGGYNNVSMTKGTGDEWYNNTIYTALGQYNYTIWANDTSGIWNSSSGHNFSIQDTNLAEISDVSADPGTQKTGGYVNISCNVTDNVGLYGVWVNITLPGGGNSNVSTT